MGDLNRLNFPPSEQKSEEPFARCLKLLEARDPKGNNDPGRGKDYQSL